MGERIGASVWKVGWRDVFEGHRDCPVCVAPSLIISTSAMPCLVAQQLLLPFAASSSELLQLQGSSPDLDFRHDTEQPLLACTSLVGLYEP